ncbi:Uncharacterized protein GBIM_15255 [Gryllus bimaculatus]|nr:Uncharacterized protein GBIM_15255 [Gryllus bimaculatus]
MNNGRSYRRVWISRGASGKVETARDPKRRARTAAQRDSAARARGRRREGGAMRERDVQIFPLSSPECVGHGHPRASAPAAAQVIFIAGILTGISLTIAGSVLRHAPSRTLSPSPSSSSGGAEGGGGGGRDKAVLVYIGCLVGLVCALLLAVQCCVRRNVKRRKRALRMSMAAAAAGRRGLAHAHAHAHAHASAGTLPHPHAHAHAHPHAHAPPPGAQQGPVHLAHGGDIPLQELQYQPLLVRLVQQQATAASSSSSGNQRLAAAAAAAAGPAPAHYHRPGHAAPAAYRMEKI